MGGRLNATASCSKWPLCEPSQKGLLFDIPQRHIEITSRPPRSYTLPFLSTISKSPSTRNEPLLLTVIFVVAIIIKNKLGAQVELNERQMLIMEYLHRHGSMQNRDFRKIFPDFSDDTVLREMGFLKKKGLIKKVGGTKKARYELS